MSIQSTFVTSMHGFNDWGYFDGSVEVNFKPQPALATVAIYQTISGGRSAVGIRRFEFRDTPGGPNKTKNFGEFFWDWPPAKFHKLMTRVTFGIDVYAGTCDGVIRVDFGS